MNRCTATLLLILAALSAARAFQELVPGGKELIYSYRGTITSGTNIPSQYASEMTIFGKLHLQLEGSSVVAQLTDVTYKLFNGKLYHGHKHYLVNMPLPEVAQDLLRPFKISYHSNGQIKSLGMEKDEKMYARNIHRAIAAVLQMDCKQVNFYSNESQAFTTTEQNLFGKSITEYNVLTKGDTIIVQKMHEMPSTDLIYSQTKTNVHLERCEIEPEELLFHDSQQKYYIKSHGKHHIAEYIETTGSFRYHPYQSLSEDYFVSSKVTLQLIDTKPITSTRPRKSEQVEQAIHYRMYDSLDKDKIDYTNGRHTVDMSKQVALIDETLCQMANYLQDPLNLKDASVNHALTLLVYCDKTALDKLVNDLKQKSPKAYEILIQILPYIGTHASVVFAKKLIFEKKVHDFEAIHILAELPGHVHNPTEELLKDLEDMLEWDHKINDQVRRSAVLCFASIIYETLKAQSKLEVPHDPEFDVQSQSKYFNFHKEDSFTETIASLFKKKSAFEAYIEKFSEMIHHNTDPAIQMLGTQALFNTKAPAVLETFVPMAKGEKDINLTLRIWALSMIPYVTTNSDFIYELYWPILTNHYEHIEVRSTAYYVLVKSSPSLTRLRNLQHFLQREIHSELYYVHYNYMVAQSTTTDPCLQKTQLKLTSILKDAPEPTYHGLSHFYQTDYTNKKYNFGEEINYIYNRGKHSMTFRFEHNLQTSNKRYNSYKMFVRVDGLDYNAFKDFRLMLNSNEKLFNYDCVINFFKSICHNKDIVIYIDRSNNRRTTHSMVIKGTDLTNMDYVYDILRKIGFTFVDNRIEVQIHERITIPFVSDIGFPVIFETVSPSINRYNVDVTKEHADNYIMHFNNHYYFSNRRRYSMSFYNPLINILQGVGKYHSTEFQFPFIADLTVNMNQGNMKLSLKKTGRLYKDTISGKLVVARQIFIKNDLDDYLKKTCPTCKLGIATEEGSHVHDSKVPMKFEWGDYLVQIDSDKPWLMGILEDKIQLYSDISKKHLDSNWEYLKMHFFYWYRLMFKQPLPTSTKMSFTLKPSEKRSTFQIDINARFKETVTQEPGVFLPGLKYNVRVTVSSKNKDEVSKTWDVHYITDINCGHTEQFVKLDLTCSEPTKKDYKFCYEGSRYWTLKDIHGNSTITVQDDEGTQDVYDITYVGKQLPEQKSPKHSYAVCLRHDLRHITDYYSMKCLAEHTSIREFVYHLKTTESSLKKLNTLVDGYINLYNNYYQTQCAEDSELSEGEIKAVAVVPTNGLGMNLALQTKHHLHTFTNVFHYFTETGNTHTSKLYMFLHENNLMQKCRASVDMINQDEIHEHAVDCPLAEFWTLYIGDVAGECDHGVYLKRIPGTNIMALKTVHGEHSLDIIPYGDNFEKLKFIVDGTEMSTEMDYYACDWFSYMHRDNNEVIINTLHFYLNIRYTVDFVDIEIPRVDGFKFYGKCFM